MIESDLESGRRMHELMTRLWPICRSITGEGVRETLSIFRERLPSLRVFEVPTGTKCFDWTVPKEWKIRDAYVIGPDGRKVVNFRESNLHVVNYSAPVDREMSLDELQTHLHSIPSQPDAVPYVTSYYKEDWGFCLSDNERRALKPGRYRAVVDSELKPGSLTYGELFLEGASKDEVLLSTYVCHPSLANNELSGPVLSAQLGEWLSSRRRRFSYRMVFIPETIGAICYLSQHLDHLKKRVIAGFVLTCVGDERTWSFMPSRDGGTLSDRVARHVLRHLAPAHTEYTFLERGSDERQYCSPGVDLPVCSVMRSKYVTYPEYHTSLDNLNLVTPRGLAESLAVHQAMIEVIETQCTPMYRVFGEPKMSDRGLRPTTGKVGSANSSRTLMNLLAYADGSKSLLEIAETIREPAWKLRAAVDRLVELDLLRLV